MSRIVRLLELKERVLEDLGGGLSVESKIRAHRDHHSRRKPRPCGMTIHTGVGCSYACAYCYIYDMGFPAKPRPHPLRPEEITYALALNPYVIPERTLAAYGSVTEPFLPETAGRAIGYMREVWRWLRLPTQFSTKSILADETVSSILSGDPKSSALITVVTLSNRRLEPRAPDPMERIKSAGRASEMGLEVSLFIRPIIPGVTDREADRILGLAAESGIRSVVPGSLRVTERILRSLERCGGADVEEIKRRIPKPLMGSKQIETRSKDLKRKICSIAEDLGLRVFRAACEANIYAHGRYCAMCCMGPCNTDIKPEPIEDEDIRDLLDYLSMPYASVEVSNTNVKVVLKGAGRMDVAKHIITAATYRAVIFKPQ